MNTNPRCITCKFFDQKDDSQGECHRFPPTVFVVGSGQTATIPTTVQVQGWCGEHVEQLIIAKTFPKFNLPSKESSQ